MDTAAVLQQQEVITPEQATTLAGALEKGTALDEALDSLGVAPEAAKKAVADYYGVLAYEFSDVEPIKSEVLNYIPEESARFYRVLPVAEEDGVLKVVTSDPDNMQMRQAMNFISGKHNLPYEFLYAPDAEIEERFKVYESLTGEVDEALDSLESQLDAEIAEKEQSADGMGGQYHHLKEDAPVTKIVATILRYAVDGKASDIHIEPTEKNVTVRFRVDGLLQKSLELPTNVHAALVARVKILSSMRLDEKRKPQDGRFSANFDGNKIDFRVSVLPTNHGEKVVMRILDTSKGIYSLADTGIEKFHMDIIKRTIKEPYGIILISGPTGSGKSTTLYSMLSEVDRLSKNVLSLEDPVEYNIEHVNQSQVRPEIGYTFAAGLRSALRQDPDIIMVGEIRDKETAQLAIQAALTGHLVFSTIHTNNSIGVIPRLIDMGVDPYLIAPTLKLAIAQRLARKICPGTGTELPVEGDLKQQFEAEFESLPERYRDRIPEMKSVKRAESTPGCTSGTRGRTAIMETLEIKEGMQDLILRNAPEEEMYAMARKNGFMSMKENAISKALAHVIPYEEVSTFGLYEDREEFAEKEVAAKASGASEAGTPSGSEPKDIPLDQVQTVDLNSEDLEVTPPTVDNQ